MDGHERSRVPEMREGDAVKPIIIKRGIFLGWVGFEHFTIEFDTMSDEARDYLLAALRDGKNFKITLEVED